MEIIDLLKLSKPRLIEERTPFEIEEAIRSDVVSLMKKELKDFEIFQSDPLAKIIQIFAYREAMLVRRVNEAARQCMLAFSKEKNLENLVALLGIDGRLSDESDDALRERALLALDGLSTAGSFSGYKFHTIDLGKGSVMDCLPFQSQPGVVSIAILFSDRYYVETNGDTPQPRTPEDIKKKNNDLKALRADLKKSIETGLLERKPLTDKLDLFEAEFVPFSIEARLVIPPGADDKTVLQEAHARLEECLKNSKKIGASVPLSALFAALHVVSVNEVFLDAPKTSVNTRKHDEKLANTKVPLCIKISIKNANAKNS